MAASKADLKRFLEGQRVVNALVREETWRRLATLTIEEARQKYDGLCRLWESSPARQDVGDFDRMRIDELVKFRQRLDLAARKRRCR
ncbi:MAG: hypothetical protein HY726_07020 [Candidatus Rokubacteria bacterium]|nr:hypothetical protein [Candidatus Rokubacteria bacterium]